MATSRKATTRPDHRRGMTRSQIRDERRRRSQARKQRRRAVLLSGGFVLAIVLILGITVGPGLATNARNSSTEGLNTGGPVALDRDAGATHIQAGQPGSGYATTPATSGPHYATATVNLPGGQTVSSPADWGRYDFALPNEVLIHNLEHGGIGLHYDCPAGCADLVQALDDFIPNGNPALFIMSPYPGLIEQTGKRIAITSWRHHLLLDDPDEAQIQEFIDEYINRAPESVPFNQY